MIDKSLQKGYLYLRIPERYPKSEDALYETTEGGLLIAKNEKNKTSVPFEIGEVLQVGRGETSDGVEVSKFIKPGDRVRIFPRRGTDFNLTSEDKGWVTFINYNDIISVV